MIVFEKIRWKNLLSTGNNFVEVDLCQNKSTILLGPSGSGKSTLLDAVSFGLFNRPFRNINKNQLVNSINQKNCVVEVEFTIGNQKFLIRRGIKPNVFEIFCNDKLINQDSHTRDYQDYLEKQILKFNFKAFSQIVVLGASNFTPFMQLKPSDRRIIIEGLLDIEIFSAMNSVLKTKASNLKSAMQENEFTHSILKEKVQMQLQHIAELSQNKQEMIEKNLAEIESQKSKIDELTKLNVADDVSIKSLQEKLNFKTEVTAQLEKVRAIKNRLHENVRQTRKEIEFYENNKFCPTCHQEVQESFKVAEVEKKNNDILGWIDAQSSAESAIEKIIVRLDEAKEIEKEIDAFRHNISKRRGEIDSGSRFIKGLAKDTLAMKNNMGASDEETSKLRTLEADMKECEEKKSSHLHEKAVHEMAAALLKDGGVKAKIIKQYLPVINKHTNLFLNSMNFFVTFNLDEEFNETIKSRGRDDFAYENFSEGEKQRIDLALLFTWRTIAKMKNSVSTNLLIMDEVLDSYLDTAATENVLQLLHSDMFRDTNMFVISHKETISDKFTKTIRFTKNKNFTTMY